MRTIVFVLASTLAAFGGILAASRLLAVNQSSGGSDLLLLAIAGPGHRRHVSLFGGRGSVWAALLGALVIGSISNGMDLLALESSVKFMITGARAAGRRRARRDRPASAARRTAGSNAPTGPHIGRVRVAPSDVRAAGTGQPVTALTPYCEATVVNGWAKPVPPLVAITLPRIQALPSLPMA